VTDSKCSYIISHIYEAYAYYIENVERKMVSVGIKDLSIEIEFANELAKYDMQHVEVNYDSLSTWLDDIVKDEKKEMKSQ
jgi:hypothetical protein